MLLALAVAFSPAAHACQTPAGKLVAMEGQVEVRAIGATAWAPARLEILLCPGDQLAVRGVGRAAVVLSNDVLVRLDQNTTLNLPAVAPPSASKADTELGLVQGAIHVISRFRKRLGVTTPFVNALVDGTEFTVNSNEQGARVVVTEGRVRTVNDAGEMSISAGEAIATNGNAAPHSIRVRPLDAVSWAIHYPQIIRLEESDLTALPSTQRPALAQARQAASQGQYQTALSALDSLSEQPPSPRITAFRASLLLGIGQLDQAKKLLAGYGPQVDQNADLSAVQTIIRVALNENEAALANAQQSANANPESAAALLALSYALQGNRQVEAALVAATRATEIAAQDPIAWSRRAELELSLARIQAGGASAQKASELSPASRARTMLGFSQLLSGQTLAAQATFAEVLAQDGTDPMAHFGQGLIHIGKGEVEAGRREVEIAVLLDPSNAELRSYLGRSYLLEQRTKVAGAQFDLARRLDPASPTPWYLDAFRKLYDNDPVGALEDGKEALARNDNRAVYRSNELLDQDRAARSASLAQAYHAIGFDQSMQSAALSALNDDPASPAAHRMLAEAYAESGVSENARFSELLQYQLRQSVGQWPLAAQTVMLSGRALDGSQGLTPEESTSLFDRDVNRFSASLVGGNFGLQFGSVLASKTGEQSQLSFGYFDYRSSGIGANSDSTVTGGRLEYRLGPSANTTLYGEIRYGEGGGGGGTNAYHLLGFSYIPQYRAMQTARQFRLGIHQRLSENEEWLALVTNGRINSSEQDTYYYLGNRRFQDQVSLGDQVKDVQAQYLLRHGALNLVTGAHLYRDAASYDVTFDYGDHVYSTGTASHDSYYAYLTSQLTPTIQAHAGLAYNHFYAQNKKAPDRLNGKLGLSFQPLPHTRVHLAAFNTIQEATQQQEMLEPTQFAGFNQRLGGIAGSRSFKRALRLVQGLGRSAEFGAEIANRKLDVPDTICTGSMPCTGRWHENRQELYLSLPLSANLAFSTRWVNESIRFDQPELMLSPSAFVLFNSPLEVRTESWPLRLWFRLSATFSGQIEATHMHQFAMGADLLGAQRQVTGSDSFWLTNLALHYRQPGAAVSWDFLAQNLFNRTLALEGSPVSNSAFVPNAMPRRNLMLRTNIRF